MFKHLDMKGLYEKIKLLIEDKATREILSGNLSKDNVDTSKEIMKLLDYIG